jgi:chaperonin GroES
MIHPAGHRVLVIQDKLEAHDAVFAKASRQGIILPGELKEAAAVDTGVVQALGPTAFKDFGGEPWCNVGQRIAFAKYAGKTLKDGETTYIILNDEDVVAVIGDKNE